MSDDRDPVREMAAAYALGALEPDEATRFRHLLATDPRLRREVQEYREVMALMAGSAAPVDPPPAGKARIRRVSAVSRSCRRRLDPVPEPGARESDLETKATLRPVCEMAGKAEIASPWAPALLTDTRSVRWRTRW